MSVPPRNLLTEGLRRWLAAGCSVLVLALAVLAASPAAHAGLHASGEACPHHGAHAGDDSARDEAGCAIGLFASGVDLPVGPAALAPPRVLAQGPTPVTATEIFLLSPRYLRQPERGPPGRV